MNEIMKSEKEAEEVPVYYQYKDRVFRFLFREKRRLLELYNALNGTAYNDEDALTVNTLENAIFIKMKNDLSFIIGCDMCLYEHQSTNCPNMPLRGLLYFADLYKKLLGNTDLSITRLVKIPTPHYIVFYNGLTNKENEFSLKLSDAFDDGSTGCIELSVRVININFGYNKELSGKCRALHGYAYFVAEIRKNLRQMELTQAAMEAVNECIKNDILKDFFLEHKSEVIALSIYEYNEEYVRKALYEDGEKNSRISIARKMLLEGMDKNFITRLTGCSDEEISEAANPSRPIPEPSAYPDKIDEMTDLP